MVPSGVPRILQADNGHRQRARCGCGRSRQRRRTGDEVRLQVELFDAVEKRRVWTREYRGPVNTVLALQRSATDGIAAALNLDLTRSEHAGLRHVPTASAEAYDLYLRGRAAQIAAASGMSANSVSRRWRAFSGRSRTMREHGRAIRFCGPARQPRHVASRARPSMTGTVRGATRRGSKRRPLSGFNPGCRKRTRRSPPTGCSAASCRTRSVRWSAPWPAGRTPPTCIVSSASHLRQVGRWEEAVSAFEHASRLDPRNKGAHQQAALTYARCGGTTSRSRTGIR